MQSPNLASWVELKAGPSVVLDLWEGVEALPVPLVVSGPSVVFRLYMVFGLLVVSGPSVALGPFDVSGSLQGPDLVMAPGLVMVSDPLILDPMGALW